LTSVLYVSYDGMTDPLGESQVLPYVLGLAARGYRFHLLSFEKPERYRARRGAIQARLDRAGVQWHPRTFHRALGPVSKLRDWWTLRRSVASLARKHGVELVHCRSYQAARAAQLLKRDRGVPYLFDMRGFWVDERVEGGIWDPSHPLYAWLYRHFKRVERTLVAEADQVVSLTRAAVEEMRRWEEVGAGVPMEVIPCCVDLELFRLQEAEARATTRTTLGLPADAPVVVYLGSLGTWYLLEPMLIWFREFLRVSPDARLLFVTRHNPDELRSEARRLGIDPNRLVIRSAQREEVPGLLGSADLSLFFIRPTYSKTASCPTKLAESLAVGLPVVCNAGVGDVDEIIGGDGLGRVLPDVEPATLRDSVRTLSELGAIPVERIRAAAESRFSLEDGVEAYAGLYRTLVGAP